ncbi:hypothetical protein F5Y10DRAFT_99463 [Nemania abortiva]|nr:hypothetical protein F5Y10DRAFT_99463 [Nemania abortiva]
MFALPDAKRIRRKDLYDSASSSEASSDGEEEEGKGGRNLQAESALHARLNAQLSGLLDLSFLVAPAAKAEQQPTPASTSAGSNAQEEDEQPADEEAFAFRLFRDEALTHTVVLTHDEDPAALGEGGFTVPSRPRSYYVASAPSAQKVAEYRSVAVSPEYVLADARRRRWGLEKPWRVIHVAASQSASESTQKEDPIGQEKKGEEKKKRTRPGKKHRILLRVREKEAREREEAAKKKASEKEQHIQEKKKRLNREKKLKRRQKEREKKAEARVANTDGPSKDVDSNASESDDE